MKDVLFSVSVIVLAFLVVMLIGWAAQGNDFFMFKFFAPKYEQVRRETFEQSKAYRQGAVQELESMRFEYIKADTPHQAALGSIILHRAADYDENMMSPDLRSFIQQLKSERKY